MKQSVKRWRRSVTVFAAVCAFMPAPLHAAVPHLVRYQGQAVDNLGVPLQGPYTLTFRLYDADAGGNIVWQEQQANVPINKGHFSVLRRASDGAQYGCPTAYGRGSSMPGP